MASFFSTQLDFIFFFYGLAFLLLGSVCFAISRGGSRSMPWAVLGTFGILHGASEWLDLIALIIGDTAEFAIARTGLMTLSFIFLLEFARLDAIRLALKIPGRWIYLPLLLLVGWGSHLAGLNGANALARYAIGAPGGAAAAVILALHAKEATRSERRWIFAAVVSLALYGVAAGLIVPATPNWAGDFFNYDDFAKLTGTPIQFVRGVLACCIAFAVWAFWGQRLASEVGSARYTNFLRKQFILTLSAMAAILVAGWLLTQYLGGIYQENVQEEARGDLELISSRLSVETAAVDGMVKAMTGSRVIKIMLGAEGKRDDQRVVEVLQSYTQTSGARAGYVLDRAGKVIASADVAGPANVGSDFSATGYFLESRSGHPAHQYIIDGSSREPLYYTSAPVRDDGGSVIGVAVLAKSLDSFEADIKNFDRSFVLADPHGLVAVTNRSHLRFTTLWPLPPQEKQALVKQYGAVDTEPLMQRKVVGSAWVKVEGARVYVQRNPIDRYGWSLATWKAPEGIFASRVLGIIITLQMAMMALIYLVGRDRWIHDNVQLEKRLELEELARNLDFRAKTDPLTGLYNRRKFNRELATEILRAQRYKTPLSLMLYDVDHFKKINDTLGHPAGDRVLIALSRFTAARIRNSDVLARWGGEEFVILSPACNGAVACQLAGNLKDAIAGLNIEDVGTVTCSFGIAEFEDGDSPDSLIARADEALYRAKINGRNRVELAHAPEVAAPHLQPAI